MWHKGAFWLTASVQANLRCLDLPDLIYTIALWAAALTSTACIAAEAHYRGSNDVEDSPSRLLLLIQRFPSCRKTNIHTGNDTGLESHLDYVHNGFCYG